MSASTDKKSRDQDLSQFENSLGELEQIVTRMEQGDQTLEESLQDFERGVALSKTCQDLLKKAEQRVAKLVKQHGEYRLEDYSPDD